MYIHLLTAFSCLFLLLPATVCGQRVARDRYMKEISFSGYDWLVKSSFGRIGPGPNFFSHSPENVSVDLIGRLHLSVNKQDGRWLCAEVVSRQSFGYGRYEFLLGSNPVFLDDNIVFGLFTWDDQLRPCHNEIDIEFSNWGGSRTQNSQYVIHNSRNEMEKKRFNMPGRPNRTLHIITWTPGKLVFRSYRGRWPWKWRKIASWTLSGDQVPAPANEKVRINLWLLGGQVPGRERNGETTIRINRFSFKAM